MAAKIQKSTKHAFDLTKKFAGAYVDQKNRKAENAAKKAATPARTGGYTVNEATGKRRRNTK